MFNFKASILNLLFKFEVVSDIPGRLRIKVNNFKKLPKEAVNFQSQAVEAVKRLDGVESVKFTFILNRPGMSDTTSNLKSILRIDALKLNITTSYYFCKNSLVLHQHSVGYPGILPPP